MDIETYNYGVVSEQFPDQGDRFGLAVPTSGWYRTDFTSGKE